MRSTPSGGISLVHRFLPDLAGRRTPAHSQLYGRARALLAIVAIADLLGWLALWLLQVGLDGWQSFVFATSQVLVGGSSIALNARYAHLVELALQGVAVFAVAALAGSLGAFFHRRGLELAPLNGTSSSESAPLSSGP